jgi:hypothetical protein
MPPNFTNSTSQLERFLTRQLDLKRSGAMVFIRDDSTVILTDMYTMSGEHLKNIEAHFPQVSISIMSSEGSRSGFLVILGCGVEQDHVWRRSLPLNRDLHAVCSEYPEGVSCREYINDGLFHGCEIFLYFNRN